MHDSKNIKPHNLRRRPPHPQRRLRHWCCSFTHPPLSPDNANLSSQAQSLRSHSSSSCNKKYEMTSPQIQQQQKLPLARRILSPGRVSPISDHPEIAHNIPQSETIPKSLVPIEDLEIRVREEGNLGDFDVRLNLKGKNGSSLILELGSEVLLANSPVFSDIIADYRKNSSGLCGIEVLDVENLNVFRETIQLMFEEDIQKKLRSIGVFRAIDVLQVSAGIKFGRGISSCLKYLEAVPWTEEEEEEKLRELLTSLNINDDSAANILDRLCSFNSVDSQRTLTKQLIWSITNSANSNVARNELKFLVKGLLCKSSVYEKNYPDLNKDDILAVFCSCLDSVITLLGEAASTTDTAQKIRKKENDKPLLEQVSKQVDNINWLLDILIDHQMAEEFAYLWANQKELLKMHKITSPMVRYELSRVSAMLFTAMGTRRLHCAAETRLALLQIWFKPMLSDFGWLQRCKKGLDMKALEEAIGQTLLTLPLKEQHALFMEWFRCFSKHGAECPNLSRAFQIWWRRSFLRGSETAVVESKVR